MNIYHVYPKYGSLVVVPACHEVWVIMDDRHNSYAYPTSYLAYKRELEGLKLILLMKVDEFERKRDIKHGNPKRRTRWISQEWIGVVLRGI
jgi:hypothetical protein